MSRGVRLVCATDLSHNLGGIEAACEQTPKSATCLVGDVVTVPRVKFHSKLLLLSDIGGLQVFTLLIDHDAFI